jgi:hypothetical protein
MKKDKMADVSFKKRDMVANVSPKKKTRWQMYL